MAYYKVGDRLLSQEEYDEDSLHKWALGLFIGGALLTGAAVLSWLPVEWPKYVRFPIVVLTGGIAGGVGAYFTHLIRDIVAWIVMIIVISGSGYGIWLLI